jgi:hypothetical protein
MISVHAIKKIGGNPTLVGSPDYNLLQLEKKLEFLIEARTEIEKEISYFENDVTTYSKFKNKRKS